MVSRKQEKGPFVNVLISYVVWGNWDHGEWEEFGDSMRKGETMETLYDKGGRLYVKWTDSRLFEGEW